MNHVTLLSSTKTTLYPGIYRIKGKSNFTGISALAEIHLHSDDYCQTLSLLVSGNGRFFEIIQVERKVTQVSIVIKTDNPEYSSYSIQYYDFKRINRLQRRLLYQALSWTYWYHFSRSQRYHHNLFWYSPALSPTRAYQSVQQYRFKYGVISYQDWIVNVDSFSEAEKLLIQRYSVHLMKRLTSLPYILVDARHVPSLALDVSLTSLSESYLPIKEVYVVTDDRWIEFSSFNIDGKYKISFFQQHELLEALSLLDASRLCIYLKAGCQLAPHAITWMASIYYDEPELTFIYTDHDQLDEKGGRCNPLFKPDWSDELAMASSYQGDVFSLKTQHVLRCLEQEKEFSSYALMLFSACERESHVKHIPAILWHAPAYLSLGHDVCARHLTTFFDRQGRNSSVLNDSVTGLLRVRDQLPNPPPMVSIIIPTRDRLDLLMPCVQSVLELTQYQRFELLIVDNQSEEQATLDYFNHISQDHRINVIHFDHAFNYSAMNNFAATQAKGSLLCLLNNDTKVLEPNWLSEMVGALQLEGVGIVGAQLRYPTGYLQHAGDLVGGSGCANHLHGKLPPEDLGYMKRVALRQDLSAVTAACLLTPKDLFLSLGGLNQTKLKIAFNDVDYCLRVREKGFRVIYTPYAKLVHYESESRGADLTAQKRRVSFREAQYMRKRWSHIMMNDPFYNPNLNYYRCDFSLDPSPMIKKPWDKW